MGPSEQGERATSERHKRLAALVELVWAGIYKNRAKCPVYVMRLAVTTSAIVFSTAAAYAFVSLNASQFG